MSMKNRGYILIDLQAIITNIHNLHKRYPSQTGIMAVIKADGYGHGAKDVGEEIEDLDCLYGFAVATCEEAFELRDAGIIKPVLVMGHIFPDAYERLIKEKISIILFRDDILEALDNCAVQLRKVVSVHIEVDTGMNRVGVKPDEQGFSFVKKVMDYPNLAIDGIYTHFARADEADQESSLQQLDAFNAFVNRIENELGLKIRLKHSSNSAGMLSLYEKPFNICRPGIAMYGIWPSNETRYSTHGIELVPALSFYSQIIMLKECPAGEAVSYGGTYVTTRPTKIATIPIGYGDGYPRSLSNKGYVLIRGQKAPILGRVCMDFFMVDVTDIPGALEGDRVTLIGNDGENEITVEELSNLSGRFRYELVCGLGKRIDRHYLYNLQRNGKY